MPTTEEVLAELDAEMEDMDYTATNAIVMLYGESGVGKSIEALEMAQLLTPEDKWILYVDSAQGYASANNHPELKRRVRRVQFRDVNQIGKYIVAIRNKLGTYADCGAIILDESSWMAGMDLDGVVRARALKDPSKDPDTAKQPDMGTSTNRVKKMYFDLLSLSDVHIISTAHIRKDKDESGYEVWSPEFLPKEGKAIRQLMHLVAFMEMAVLRKEGEEDKIVRVFQVHPSDTRVAKTRIGGLNPKVSAKTLHTQMIKWLGTGGHLVEETELVLEHRGNNASENEEGVEI